MTLWYKPTRQRLQSAVRHPLAQAVVLVLLVWVALVTSLNSYLPLMNDWMDKLLPNFNSLLRDELGLDAHWTARRLQLTYLGQLQLELYSPTIIADASLPEGLGPVPGGKPLRWYLGMNRLKLAADPVALIFGRGDGAIRDIILDKPVFFMDGPDGQQAVARYIQWVVKKYHKETPSKIDWMRRSAFLVNDYTIVSSSWPLPTLFPNWQGPVRLTGKDLAVRLGRKQHWQVQGDVALEGIQLPARLYCPVGEPARSVQWQRYGDIELKDVSMGTLAMPKSALTVKPTEGLTLDHPKAWLDSVDGLDIALTNWKLRPLIQQMVPIRQQGQPVWQALSRQGMVASLALTLNPKGNLPKPLAPRQLVAHLAAKSSLPHRSKVGQTPSILTPWPDLDWQLAGQVAADIRTVDELTSTLKQGDQTLTATQGQLANLHTKTPTGSITLNGPSLLLSQWQWLAQTLPPSLAPWVSALQGQLSVEQVRVASTIALAAPAGSSVMWQPTAGQIRWHNWTMALPGQPQALALQQGEALIRFLPQRWHVPQFMARIGTTGGHLSAHGNGGYQPTSPLAGQVSLQQLPIPWLLSVAKTLPNASPQANRVLAQVRGSGSMGADVALSGTMAHPTPEGQVNLHHAQLVQSSTGQVLTALTGPIALSAHGATTLAQSPLAVTLAGSPVAVGFALPFNRQEPGWAALKGQHLSLARLRQAAQTWTTLLNQPVPWATIPHATGWLSVDAMATLHHGQVSPQGQLVASNLATTLSATSTAPALALSNGQVKLTLKDSLLKLLHGQATIGQFGMAQAVGQYHLNTRQYRGQVAAKGVQLAAALPFIPASARTTKPYSLQHLSGSANLLATVEGIARPGQSPHLRQFDAQGNRLVATVSGLPSVVSFNTLLLHLDPRSQHLTLAPTTGRFGPITLSVGGWLDTAGMMAKRPPRYDATVNTAALPVASLHTDQAFWQALVPGFKADIYNTAGSVSAMAHLTSSGHNGTVQFNQAGLYMARTPMPIHQVEGVLAWSQPAGSGAKGNKAGGGAPMVSLATPLTMRLGNGEFTLNTLALGGAASNYSVALSGQGKLTEIELNNLIGNPWYYQPTEYPVQTSLALDVSGHWQPGQSSNNQLTIRTGSVVHVQEVAPPPPPEQAPPIEPIDPSKLDPALLKPPIDKKPEKPPKPAKVRLRPQPPSPPRPDIPPETPPVGLIDSFTDQMTPSVAVVAVGNSTSPPAALAMVAQSVASPFDPPVTTRLVGAVGDSASSDIIKDPPPVGRGLPLDILLNSGLDPALAGALQGLLNQTLPGYHALFTVAATAQLTPQQLWVPEAQVRLMGQYEPVRVTMRYPFLPASAPRRVKVAKAPMPLVPTGFANPIAPLVTSVETATATAKADTQSLSNPSTTVLPTLPGLTGRIWMAKPLHLPDLNKNAWNPSYQFDKGDVALDIVVGHSPLLTANPVAESLQLAPVSPPPLAETATALPPVTLSTGTAALPLTGHIVLKDVVAPNLLLDKLNAQILLQGQQAVIDVQSLEAVATQMRFKGMADNLTAYPWLITQGELTGQNFYVDGFQKFIAALTQQGLGPVTQGRPSSRKWLAADPLKLPFAIDRASVRFDEAVVNNIILNDVTATLNLFGNGYTELDELKLKAAGGSATGRLFIHPQQDNLLSLTLDSQQVEANALAKVLLDAPNEIFGDLSGRIQFTTFGNTNNEMIQNANGMSSFQIADGRIPTLAKVETLLTVANLYRGGLLGLNLNNIVRAVKAFDTNYFAFLYGDFQIAHGVIYTSNLMSDGENLDILAKGGIRLDNGVGNLLVVGNMSQTVKGGFGRLGQLSLRNLTQYVPLLGFIPGKKNVGLLNYVPGVGYLPGVGGMAKDVNTFSVRMEGPLEDPASVKDLKWLR